MLKAFPKREKVPAEVKAELHRLKELSRRAQTGDAKARKELREALERTSPELIAHTSDFMKWGQKIVIQTITEADPLMRETLPLRLEAMRTEIAGENPGALEALLAERITSLWFTAEVLDALVCGWFHRGEDAPRPSLASARHFYKWSESLNKRLLASIRELVHLRRVQSGIPDKQTNVQINVEAGAANGASPKKEP